jgi:hypothetical protein
MAWDGIIHSHMIELMAVLYPVYVVIMSVIYALAILLEFVLNYERRPLHTVT